ncbi:hypothetical protein CXF85_21710 [Colwellia sp. 75C3]|uniref:DUF7281 domain-containing protein n=1 Tax=Colwellia sp. 75C3 TaxID=888425 RepID=UPI000C34BC3F|nr:hypothetical protein [Colwellia sp. 75C3]PKG80733.1 hypothetical protein CXF85_21710 [Colwellia sp. 75C3]
MKTVMNKQLYNFTQDKLQKHRQGGQIKNSALATRLYEEYNFGQLDFNKQSLTFTLQDILALSEEIQRSVNLDIRQDPYPTKKDRLSTAEKCRNEKDNSYAVSKDFILINSLSTLKVNQTNHELSPLNSLGIYIKADDIISIEHKTIIFVENLAVMANLALLNLLSCSADLTDALWIYRGDIKKQQSTGTAYEFFRRFKNHQRICFSDVDPKGIEISLTSHADYWLTIKDIDSYIKTVQSLQGNEQEWFKQSDSIKYLQKILFKQDKTDQKKYAWEPIFSISAKMQKTLKQEHILKHNLALTLLSV